MNESLKNNTAFKALKLVLDFLLSNWFFLGLGVLIALAHLFPDFAKQGGTIKAEFSIGYGAVAVIFLISGLLISTEALFYNLSKWRAHFTVLSMSFLITSSIAYGICSGIRASNDPHIDDWLLVGLIVAQSCPTTVSSNVVMTKAADGNDVLTVSEVVIGNVLGAFITPALVQMYLTGPWEFGNPAHQGADITVTDLYRNVMKQIGLAVFVPLLVGQIVQYFFPNQTKWCLTTFRLSNVGSFMLLLIMFQSFSTAFAQNAFASISQASVIFLVFFNIGIYLFFTVIAYFYLRPLFILRIFGAEPVKGGSWLYKWNYRIFRPFFYDRRDTVAIMLCGPSKTAALGVSLISSQYGAHNPKLGILLVPLVLYQAEQVFTAQILVKFMAKWVHADDISKDQETGALIDDSEDGIDHQSLDSISSSASQVRK